MVFHFFSQWNWMDGSLQFFIDAFHTTFSFIARRKHHQGSISPTRSRKTLLVQTPKVLKKMSFFHFSDLHKKTLHKMLVKWTPAKSSNGFMLKYTALSPFHIIFHPLFSLSHSFSKSLSNTQIHSHTHTHVHTHVCTFAASSNFFPEGSLSISFYLVLEQVLELWLSLSFFFYFFKSS